MLSLMLLAKATLSMLKECMMALVVQHSNESNCSILIANLWCKILPIVCK